MTPSASDPPQSKPALPFKDRIDAKSIGRLAAALQRASPGFPADSFTRRALHGLGLLELKGRIAHVADALAASLPGDFASAAESIERMLDARPEQDGFGGWWRRAESIAYADAERAERLRWVVRRGLRSLVKDGHAQALRLLGYDPDADLQARAFRIDTPVVRLGDALHFTLTLACTDRDTAHRVVLDYAIGFPRADGRPGRKVFKWGTLDLAAGEARTLQRRHPIRAVTTRAARPGRHTLEAQANGRVIATGSFRLRIDAA